MKSEIINGIVSKFPEINSKYDKINYGGCGTFSYHLSKRLKDKYDINSEIIYRKHKDPPGKRPDFDIRFDHIFVKVDHVIIDNNGIYQFDNSDKFGSLSFDKLEEMIKIPELWNNTFDHSKTDELVKDIYEL
jgi:hypothetical protein